MQELIGGPDDLARDPIGELHLRASGGEIKELFGVDLGKGIGVPNLGQMSNRGRRSVAGVVPTLKRGNQDRSTQCRDLAPDKLGVRRHPLTLPCLTVHEATLQFTDDHVDE